MRWGTDWPAKHDLSSLRLLGSVGEPINPEAWVWYHQHIGGEPLPDRRYVVADRDGRDHDHAAARRHDARSPDRRRSRSPASPPRSSTTRASTVPVGGGLLALTRPWPSMLRGDLRRSRALRAASTGAAGGRGIYFTGDGAKRDDDGYFWLLGRVDDVINVAGHRIGTMEVESALVDHPEGRRSRRRRPAARDQGPGDCRVRHA